MWKAVLPLTGLAEYQRDKKILKIQRYVHDWVEENYARYLRDSLPQIVLSEQGRRMQINVRGDIAAVVEFDHKEIYFKLLHPEDRGLPLEIFREL